MKIKVKLLVVMIAVLILSALPVSDVSARGDLSNICQGNITSDYKEACRVYQKELKEDIEKQSSKLDELEEKIKSTRVDLDKQQVQLDDMNLEIEKSDAFIIKVQSEIDKLDDGMMEVEERIVRKELEIESKELEITTTKAEVDESFEQLQEVISNQQVNLYKNNYLAFIFSSNSFGELFQRITLIDKVASKENEIMDELEDLQQKLISQNDELIEQREELKHEESELVRQLALSEIKKHEAEVKQRENELLKLQMEKVLAEYVHKEREMIAQAKAIESSTSVSNQAIGEIQGALAAAQAREDAAKKEQEEKEESGGGNTETPKPPVDDSNLSSPLAFAPIRNGFYVSAGAWYYPSSFLGGGTHDGIDMAASMGTTIVAPSDMAVVAAYSGCPSRGGLGSTCGLNNNWGGNQVIGIYRSGNSLYASPFYHMQTVNVRAGQFVTKGTPIGTVGSSGNSTGPHLHFEMNYLGDMSISDYLETWDGVLNFTNGRGSMGHNWNWRCENKGTAPCKQNPNDFFGLQVGRSY